jgi:hypothetical protein
MNDRHLVAARERKYTQAYIERWIRPLPAKPTHPHDTGKRVTQADASESLGKRIFLAGR